jgi:o-succinylbenzoate synthase
MDVVTEWKIYSFEIPFVASGIRKGILVAIGNDRWAEVSPLPGRSRETFDEAVQQLVSFFSGKHKGEIFPSVQFGLESLFRLQFEPMQASTYALLSGTPDEVLRQAEIAAKQGYATVKLKVASFSIQAAQDLMRTLQKRFALRIDCNSAFSFEEAVSLFSPFGQEELDYIEDPTFETDKLHAFTHPFALDETVTKFHTMGLENCPKLYGFILKPTILGGKKGCAPYVEYAKQHNLSIVFSPAFESGLGLMQILKLAKEFGLEGLVGLDTYRYLKHDLLQPSVNFSTPKFSIDTPPQINPLLLTEIAHGLLNIPFDFTSALDMLHSKQR